ncbi:trypsin-like serine protease [Aminipila butyrica]|uniref:Trypsin-like serine protease n=1 Tax=Aminipila butyrica TaxID=433296 RepID=A0A858BSE3_9FIRM|nr:trypsin-like peptidase domain-containing protein [Aminipila butyrica]QIB68129.1 trypsin-like serine protease [Aminipila butyrica]
MNHFNHYYSGENNNREPIQDVNFVIIEESSGAGSETNHGSPHKRKFHFKKSRMGIALVVVLCLLTSAAFGFGGALLANSLSSESSSFGTRSQASQQLSVSKTGTTLEQSTDSNLTIKEIAALNANSVVEIKTEAMVTDSWMQQYVTEGAGSGVIVSSDGYIVTNNHVIENSNKITVTLKNSKSYTATLIGTDDETDIAVLKIDASGLTPVVYGDSSALEVGDLTVVIGNPLGSLGGTVTAGIVSALDRSITIDGKNMTLLQTDASINPGNSGGGMFNQNGELVGVIVAKSSGSDVEGLGFAIPVNEVKKIAQELADYGYVRGRIDTGMTFIDLTSMRNAVFYGATSLGIYVKSVDSDFAKAAGFKSGDMIYYVGDKKISAASDLTSAFDGYEVGDKVQITIVRNNDNEMKKLTLTLGEKTSS